VESTYLRGSTRRTIFLVCLGVMLVALTLSSEAQAAFPGANGKIAFASDRDDPNPGTCDPCAVEIYTIDPDGSDLTRLTYNHGSRPEWSPDGQKIAFNGVGGVYVMNADGTGQTLIRTNAWDPTWSADGKELVVVEPGPDPEDSWYRRFRRIKPDGTDLGILYDNCPCVDPALSPDGINIAYGESLHHSGVGAYALKVTPYGFILDPEIPNQYEYDLPNWRPDAARLAFHFDWGDESIRTVDPNGDNLLVVRGPATQPAWSPDGARIAFQDVWAFGASSLAVMDADGGNVLPLTTGPARDVRPDWQPLRAFANYPRPGGASPMLVYLVPAYEACTSPNSTHVAPLDQGSCSPPVRVSDLLTTSTVGQGKGYVRLDSVPGNPSTPADEADVALDAQISDVRSASDQSDYTGTIILSLSTRTTDRWSGFGGVAATTSDSRFEVPLSCVATEVTPKGSDCGVNSSFDALLPGAVREGKRTILATKSVSLLDAGPDGAIASSGCPPTCGTGDEDLYMQQGTFAP
jgi:hypothetical protein